VLWDLKMPHKNGLEVLKWIREQPSLSGLRVVMLTSSDQARDVNMAYPPCIKSKCYPEAVNF
jgi:two-component system response regulator